MDRVRLAGLYGVDVTYSPGPGREVPVAEETVVAVLAALGVDASTAGAVRDALAAHETRAAHALLPPCTVVRGGGGPLASALRGRVPKGTRLSVETERG
ncbi:MAG TPA: 4-alpha-glucanotransferase, partial [Streptomyces sp.]